LQRTQRTTRYWYLGWYCTIPVGTLLATRIVTEARWRQIIALRKVVFSTR